MNALEEKRPIKNDKIRSSVGRVVETIDGSKDLWVWFQGTYWKAIPLHSSQSFYSGQEVQVIDRVNTLILVVTLKSDKTQSAAQ